MKRKPFLPDTPVRLIATPATTYTVVSHKIINGDDIFVVKNGTGVESDVVGNLLEVNPGAVPTDDFPYS